MRKRHALGLLGGLALLGSGCTWTGHPGLWVIPEQRCLEVRDPATLPPARLPEVPPPPTVTALPSDDQLENLALDEAIRIALRNSRVVRVLAGFGAGSSGRTIYDPAISNTAVDDAKGFFDPALTIRNNFNRNEQPVAIFDPNAPEGVRITGTRVTDYDFGLGLTKRTVAGGTFNFDVTSNTSRFTPGLFPLNPQERSSATLSYTQPLLQGAGPAANLVPVILARIDTERSYFQFKDSVQELVRGVIEGYWGLVSARADRWARQQQVDQGKEALERADARQRRGFATAAEVAQAKVALANFRSGLLNAEAALLNREAALRNVLGLPPNQTTRLVPVSIPQQTRVEPKWTELVRLAGERRPDLIELKLIVEADQQTLLRAQNQAQPRVDATLLYRWNGLEGETPSGARVASEPGAFTDWTLGVNFSVPLGLRRERAALRRAELLLARDWANLDQGLHAATHTLAANVRNLAQSYEQYKIQQETRKAARENLDQQLADFRAGRTIFLNVLQAISSWGDAVSGEAAALTQYNTELANLERQTGTILETHGICFHEERYGSIGPLGRLCEPCFYPHAVVPGPNSDRYPTGTEPAERTAGAGKPAVTPRSEKDKKGEEGNPREGGKEGRREGGEEG